VGKNEKNNIRDQWYPVLFTGFSTPVVLGTYSMIV